MKFFVFTICIFVTFQAFASESTNLPLRGQGDYKWFMLHVYEAKLWGEKVDDLYSKPLLLELKYSRNFKGKEIAEQSVKELISAGNSREDVEVWKKKLLEIFPDVKEGDTIRASYHPDNGVIFHLNQSRELGRLADLNFSKKFLDIWLGEKTSAPELRKKLLGKNI